MKKGIVLLLGVLCLTSCESRFHFYDYGAYNSPVFIENYYADWDTRLQPFQNEEIANPQIIDPTQIFTDYNDPQFQISAKLGLVDGAIQPLLYASEGKDGFGPYRKSSLASETLKYGHTSKLFDGKMICNGRFQKVRVQIDEGGFGYDFGAELYLGPAKDLPPGSEDFLAIQLKALIENVPSSNIPALISLDFAFYVEGQDENLDQIAFRFENIALSTASGSLANEYTFLGFHLPGRSPQFNVDQRLYEQRIKGMSISYTLHNKAAFPGKIGVMLYEVFLPNGLWL